MDRPDRDIYSVENYVGGAYIKHQNNSGFVGFSQQDGPAPAVSLSRRMTGAPAHSDDEDTNTILVRATPQAFSHFSYVASEGQLIIVDLQGVGDLYTDPQCHSCTGEGYGEGNLGLRGIALFFGSHQCNAVCRFDR